MSDATYPTVGTDGSNPTATVFGNFKCPYTRQFVLGNLAPIVEEFVKTGRLNLQFRSVAYEPDPSDPSHGSSVWYISSSDPRIAETALAGWNVDPKEYWAFFRDMFENQVSGDVSRSKVVSRMDAAGMDSLSDVAEQADSFEEEVKASADAAAEVNLQWTPWMEFKDETISPHHEKSAVMNFLDARAPPAGSSASSDDTSSSTSTESEQTSTESTQSTESTASTKSTDSSSGGSSTSSSDDANSTETSSGGDASTSSTESEETDESTTKRTSTCG